MSNKKRNKRRQNNTPASQQSGSQTQLTHTERIQQFSGPIPSPDIMERYNEIVPDAAERILTMAEADAAHQRQIEMAALTAQRRERRLGQCFGFAIGLSSLSVSAWAIFKGYETVASIVGGTTVLGLVTVFVTGRFSKSAE